MKYCNLTRIFLIPFLYISLSCSKRQTVSAWPTLDPLSKRNIGMHHGQEIDPPFKSEGGFVLGEWYSISLFSQGSIQALWLNIFSSRNAKGQTEWEVIDVLKLPEVVTKRAPWPWVHRDCEINGVHDAETIGITVELCADAWAAAKKSKDPNSIPAHYSNVHFAWRLDKNTRKLKSLASSSVKCRIDFCDQD